MTIGNIYSKLLVVSTILTSLAIVNAKNDGIYSNNWSVFGDNIHTDLTQFAPILGKQTPAYYFQCTRMDRPSKRTYPFYQNTLTAKDEVNSQKTHGLNHIFPNRFNGQKINRVKSTTNTEMGLGDVLYPEVLIILDNSFIKSFKNRDEFFTYLLNFWTKVDKIYKSSKQPEIKLSIGGFAIAEDDRVFRFMRKNAQGFGKDDKIDFEGVLNDAGKWLYETQRTIPLDSYDIAIIHSTKLPSKSKNRPDQHEPNMAFLNNACVVDHKKKIVKNVAVVYDDLQYNSVVDAARALAHTLGADNDVGKCVSQNSLMSSVASDKSINLTFSQCSLNAFKAFAKTNPQCLYNVPEQFERF